MAGFTIDENGISFQGAREALPDYWYGTDFNGYLVKVEVTEAEKDFMRANMGDSGMRARAAAQAAKERQYQFRINGEEYTAKADPERLPTTTEPSNVEVLWTSIAGDETVFYWDGEKLLRCVATADGS